MIQPLYFLQDTENIFTYAFPPLSFNLKEKKIILFEGPILGPILNQFLDFFSPGLIIIEL